MGLFLVQPKNSIRHDLTRDSKGLVTSLEGHISMDLESLLLKLREESDNIDAAIINLKRLERPGKPGPDRPHDSAGKIDTNGANGNHRPDR